MAQGHHPLAGPQLPPPAELDGRQITSIHGHGRQIQLFVLGQQLA
jgi:hypothetical protein